MGQLDQVEVLKRRLNELEAKSETAQERCDDLDRKVYGLISGEVISEADGLHGVDRAKADFFAAKADHEGILREILRIEGLIETATEQQHSNFFTGDGVHVT